MKFWSSLNPPWGHVKSHTKFGPDRFSRFGLYWTQTNTQTPKHIVHIMTDSVRKCYKNHVYTLHWMNKVTFKKTQHLSLARKWLQWSCILFDNDFLKLSIFQNYWLLCTRVKNFCGFQGFDQTLYLGSILNKVSTFFVEIKMSQYPIMNWSNIRGYDFLADLNAHCYFVKDHTAERSNCICNLYWCEPWLFEIVHCTYTAQLMWFTFIGTFQDNPWVECRLPILQLYGSHCITNSLSTQRPILYQISSKL